jgi:hypothetical protein
MEKRTFLCESNLRLALNHPPIWRRLLILGRGRVWLWNGRPRDSIGLVSLRGLDVPGTVRDLEALGLLEDSLSGVDEQKVVGSGESGMGVRWGDCVEADGRICRATASAYCTRDGLDLHGRRRK